VSGEAFRVADGVATSSASGAGGAISGAGGASSSVASGAGGASSSVASGAGGASSSVASGAASSSSGGVDAGGPCSLPAAGLLARYSANALKNQFGLADGVPIDTWNDVSPQQLDLAKVGGDTTRPVLHHTGDGFNGHARVTFDGMNDAVQKAVPASALNGANGLAFTVFAVASSLDPMKSKALLRYFDGASNPKQGMLLVNDGMMPKMRIAFDPGMVSVAAADGLGTNPTLWTAMHDALSIALYRNGALQAAKATVAISITTAPLNLGGGGSASWKGSMADVLIYTGALADADRSAIEACLIQTYGL
jgi:hypothetical protein